MYIVPIISYLELEKDDVFFLVEVVCPSGEGFPRCHSFNLMAIHL